MNPPGPAFVAVLAIVAAAVIIGATISFSGHGSNAVNLSTFSFSQNLPTGSMASNGQLDCGSNVTASLAVPSYSDVSMTFAINQSGDSANVWMTGPGFENTGFLSVGGGGIGPHETLGVAQGGQLKFFLQGCGPGPIVPLGLWGNITTRSASP
jgi:hypothetical protein